MEYFLNDLQKEVKRMARTIAEEKILPVRAALDEKEEFPRDIMKNLADTDLLGVMTFECIGYRRGVWFYAAWCEASLGL